MEEIERRKEALRSGERHVSVGSTSNTLIETRRQELLRAVEQELHPQQQGGFAGKVHAQQHPAVSTPAQRTVPNVQEEAEEAVPAAVPVPAAAQLDISNELWESTWEENQTNLERNIGILNDDHHLAEVVNKGTNLQQYAEDREAALRSAEEQSIDDYIAHTARFAQLYSEITECEETLDSVRSVVWGFREHLGNITGDIRALQKRSAEITESIKNRESALLHLSPVLQKIDVITPAWLRAIEATSYEEPDARNRVEQQREGEARFLSAVRRLDEKLNFMTEDPHLQDSVMQEQLQPQLLSTAKKLSLKVERFLKAKMEGLREGTGVNLVKQQALAHRCSFVFRFLRQHRAEAAEHIASEYVDLMNKSYVRNVKKSTSGDEAKLARHELIVSKDMFDAKKGVETEGNKLLKKVINVKQRDRVTLSVAERSKVLAALVPSGDQLVVDPSVMVSQKRTYVEDFVTVNAAIINGAVQEAAFMSEFFSYPSARRESMLSSAFEKAFSHVQERTNDILSSAGDDIVGIVLLLRVCECMFSHLLPRKADHFHSDPNALKSTLVITRTNTTEGATGAGIAERSKNRNFSSPTFLISHLKDVQARLWGMYSETMAAHVGSVREAAGINFAAVKMGSARSVEDSVRTAAAQLKVHTSVKRYVELACNLHTLNTTPVVGSRVSGSSEGSLIFSDALVADLATLRKEVLRLIEHLAARFSAVPLTPFVFVANNLSEILQGFTEGHVSASFTEDPDVVEALLRQHVTQFAQQEMQNEMAQMCTIIKSSNVSDVSDEAGFAQNRMQVDVEEVTTVAEWFHGQWRQLLARAGGRVSLCFSNKFTAQYVLRCVFTTLVDLNESLCVLVSRLWANPPFRNKLVSKEVIAHEIQAKYIPTF